MVVVVVVFWKLSVSSWWMRTLLLSVSVSCRGCTLMCVDVVSVVVVVVVVVIVCVVVVS